MNDLILNVLAPIHETLRSSPGWLRRRLGRWSACRALIAPTEVRQGSSIREVSPALLAALTDAYIDSAALTLSTICTFLR